MKHLENITNKQPKAHCLFEQAGTFKNEFKKLGIPCEDYDILNDFGETENEVDLFQAIRDCYEWKQSILDRISRGDIVMAFFPCTRFEAQIILSMRGENCGMKGWTDEKKLEYSMRIQRELSEYFELVSKLVIIAIRGGVENGYRKSLFRATLFDKILAY